jgi:tRNA threonylcarbamoyladenosine biosynthesis protein TsaB
MEENPSAPDHASWLHPAISRMMEQSGIAADQLRAVAVTAGPGSYTGLRVGMAAAKGLCYALDIPLIGVNSLELMATAMVQEAKEKNALICPMIDARRQEVFTAIYTADMQEIQAPCALILDKTSFEEWLGGNRILFTGSGSEKWKGITASPQALFMNQKPVIQSFAHISQRYFLEKRWTDLVFSEPIYLKEFYTHSKN